MDAFTKIVTKIIQEQENIIGPIAIEQAQKVPGLQVDWSKRAITINGDEKATVEALVDQYKHLFGQTSVEVCKEVVKEFLSEIPANKRPAFVS